MLQRDGYIYFILAAEVARVKIGHTRGVPAFRVDELRTGSPVELVNARVIFGSVTLERALHKWFADRRVIGEWFDASVLEDVDAAVFEITGRRASPPRIPNPETNSDRNPVPINTLSEFQGLAPFPPLESPLEERPSRPRSLSSGCKNARVEAVAYGRVRVGGNAQTEENA